MYRARRECCQNDSPQNVIDTPYIKEMEKTSHRQLYIELYMKHYRKQIYLYTTGKTQLQYSYKEGKLLLYTKCRISVGRGGMSLCDGRHEAIGSWNRPFVAVTTPRGCYYRKPSNEEMTLKHRINYKI